MHHVGVGDVEVMFKQWNRYLVPELASRVDCSSDGTNSKTHVSLHVILPSGHSTLPQLHAELSCHRIYAPLRVVGARLLLLLLRSAGGRKRLELLRCAVSGVLWILLLVLRWLGIERRASALVLGGRVRRRAREALVALGRDGS